MTIEKDYEDGFGDDSYSREQYYRARKREAQESGKTCPYCGEPITAKYRICDACMDALEQGLDLP